MVDHAELGEWEEQREKDPRFDFWFDITVFNFICPECLARGEVSMMEQHEDNIPHYHCMACGGGFLNRQLVPWLAPYLPKHPGDIQ